MPTDVPFDVWNGEDLTTAEVIEPDSAEEVAMHLEEDGDGAAGSWSALVGADDGAEVPPVSYFADEQPEADRREPRELPVESPEPDLAQMLTRQHYTFRA